MSRELNASQLASLHAPLATICATATGRHGWSPGAIQTHRHNELLKAPRQSRLWDCRLTATKTMIWCIVGFMLFALVALGQSFEELFGEDLAQTIALISMAMGLSMIVVGDTIKLRGPAEWRIYALEHFEEKTQQKLPLLVTDGVTQIRAAVPGATFTVHALMQDAHILDPILEVKWVNPRTGKEEIEFPFVWDAEGTIVQPY